ncbi:MAG: hypothetical protein OHK0046_04460 [Anaerolineae bacterium]
MTRRLSPDTLAILLLILLWSLFFWRLFTPNAADQVSLQSGDFSGQFVAFGAYQYARFSSGEVPLWNPYNNGGLPFIADTQAAVFYPPRLLTIAAASLSGTGWTYNALQIEMTLHVLAYTLLMYVFMRRLTLGGGVASVGAGFVAAIIAGYGGFMSGYPPLQLALLEAAVWLPLALLGVMEATRQASIRPFWWLVSGLALGLSWMAGHPQTSWLATYLVVVYLAYRVYTQGYAWRMLILGTGVIGTITIGLAAVQLFPGFEYLNRTMRAGFSFDEKGGGFPVQDVIQLLFPGVVSLFSPLFVGISGLALAALGLMGKDRERWFWGGVLVVALGLSFGANSVFFHAFYNLLPGLSFFRGQERAAYLVANSLAILAGLGVIVSAGRTVSLRRVLWGLGILFGVCALIAGSIFVLWLGNREPYGDIISPVMFSTFMAGLFLLLWANRPAHKSTTFLLLLGVLVVFELFSVNIDNQNYEHMPANAQPIMQTPPLVQQILADTDAPFRVEGGLVRGEIGLYGGGNTGSLYRVADIRGISPLFLDGPHAIIQRELPAPTAWELFAVRYVLSDAEELPVASEIIGRDYPEGETLNLHRLADPRPFAHLVYDAAVVDSDAFARALLQDSAFNPRTTVIIHSTPPLELPVNPPDSGQVQVTHYAPERFTIIVSTPENALLSVAHVDYPGWEVTLDDESVDPLRAYGALTAIPIPAGEHTVVFRYNPLSYRLGGIFSFVTWVGILGALMFVGVRAGVLNANRRKSTTVDRPA